MSFFLFLLAVMIIDTTLIVWIMHRRYNDGYRAGHLDGQIDGLEQARQIMDRHRLSSMDAPNPEERLG